MLPLCIDGVGGSNAHMHMFVHLFRGLLLFFLASLVVSLLVVAAAAAAAAAAVAAAVVVVLVTGTLLFGALFLFVGF